MEARFFGRCCCKKRKKKPLPLNPIDSKVLDNEETVFKQKQTGKKSSQSEKNAQMRQSSYCCYTTVTVVADDEKRQNERRLSTGIERIFFLKHTSVAKIDRCCCFFSSLL